MFDINNYQDILIHIQSTLKRCKPNSSGWIETFCPYCDDAIRKFNPSHGHFHISPTYPFCHCFRCSKRIGLRQFLIDIGYTNAEVLNSLKSFSNFTYNKSKITGITVGTSLETTYKKLKEPYDYFIQQNNISLLNQVYEYIYGRCLDIDPVKFFLYPYINNNILQVRFMNYNGEVLFGRNLTGKDRYQIIGKRKYYYFQNLLNIDKYENIVITEGGFDAINLYNYYYPFKNSFFIAVGGSNYKGVITDLINSFLLIGKYNFSVVFDRGLKFQDTIIKSIVTQCNLLNPEVTFEFYLPSLSKDVSELMLLEKL